MLSWYDREKRNLPWRETKDPYKIWLSEIILQQTRVDQGLPYWLGFVEKYPTVETLAEADEESVLRLWQGLGYYSRARNLHATAKQVAREFNGHFPDTYALLLKLKGVGPYTAAAIASFAFKEAVPVVDGNVFRFVSRLFGLAEDTSKAATRKLFEEKLQNHISKERPDSFNQAIMEYGARICTPRPKCECCIFQAACYAKEKKLIATLPVKRGKVKVRERHLNYVIFHDTHALLMNRRKESDIWKGLYDFYLIEGKIFEEDVLEKVAKISSDFSLDDVSKPFKHVLSHQKLLVRFYLVRVSGEILKKISGKKNLVIIDREDVITLPKPKLILNYLNNSPLKDIQLCQE